MKTKSRKRLLISSVAMLLVAMLALGTATFAWFTQNTSATANEFSAKTVKASELKLSSESIDWTDTLNYGYKDKVLKPVSTVDGINWFTAVAANKDSYATTKALAEKVESADKYTEDSYKTFKEAWMQQTLLPTRQKMRMFRQSQIHWQMRSKH